MHVGNDGEIRDIEGELVKSDKIQQQDIFRAAGEEVAYSWNKNKSDKVVNKMVQKQNERLMKELNK